MRVQAPHEEGLFSLPSFPPLVSFLVGEMFRARSRVSIALLFKRKIKEYSLCSIFRKGLAK